MDVFMVKATNKYGVKSTQIFTKESEARKYELYLSGSSWKNIKLIPINMWATADECKDILHKDFMLLHAGIAFDFDCSLCKECDKNCPFA